MHSARPRPAETHVPLEPRGRYVSLTVHDGMKMDDDYPLIGCKRIGIDPCQSADQIALGVAPHELWMHKVDLDNASPSGTAFDVPGGHRADPKFIVQPLDDLNDLLRRIIAEPDYPTGEDQRNPSQSLAWRTCHR